MTTKLSSVSQQTEIKSFCTDFLHSLPQKIEKRSIRNKDKRKQQKYDALCLEPIPPYDSKKINALRKSLQVSQSVLASVLNTSLSTVRKWEIGEKNPSGPSLKLLDLLERKGLEAVL